MVFFGRDLGLGLPDADGFFSSGLSAAMHTRDLTGAGRRWDRTGRGETKALEFSMADRLKMSSAVSVQMETVDQGSKTGRGTASANVGPLPSQKSKDGLPCLPNVGWDERWDARWT